MKKLKERRHYEVMKRMRQLLLDSTKDVGVSIQQKELTNPLKGEFEDDELAYTFRLLQYKDYLRSCRSSSSGAEPSEDARITEKGFTEWLFPLGPENKRKAFISYAEEDKELAGRIKEGLKEVFDEIFLAHDGGIPVGFVFRDRLLSEMITSGVFIALRTENYEKANYTEQECGFALALNKRIVCLWLGTDPEKSGFCGAHQGLPFNKNTPIDRIILKCKQVFVGF